MDERRIELDKGPETLEHMEMKQAHDLDVYLGNAMHKRVIKRLKEKREAGFRGWNIVQREVLLERLQHIIKKGGPDFVTDLSIILSMLQERGDSSSRVQSSLLVAINNVLEDLPTKPSEQPQPTCQEAFNEAINSNKSLEQPKVIKVSPAERTAIEAKLKEEYFGIRSFDVIEAMEDGKYNIYEVEVRYVPKFQAEIEITTDRVYLLRSKLLES